MLNRSSKYKSKDSVKQNAANLIPNKSSNYGLGVPSESLLHITSYLDPPSLLALSRVNSTFFSHVQDDHTWHMAFNQNFLGIDPQGSPAESKNIILLRRSEPSWKREYVVRFNIRKRWEKSRTGSVTHVPLHSPISQIHLLPSATLLSSSLQYGIVSRSLPLAGKILRGYLSPSPAGTGLGIGNPNTEFAPNVTACAMFSEGSSAKIVWGMRSGEVAIMSAIKVSDPGKRTPAKLSRCKVDEEHQTDVVCVAWDDSGALAISGARDGSVKLWDAATTRCLWTSERKDGSLVPDPCKLVISAVAQGVVATGLESGDILVWYGFNGILSKDPIQVPPNITQLKISCPCPSSPSEGLLYHVPEITSIHADVSGTTVGLLLTYKSQAEFYRLCLNTADGSLTPFVKFSNPTAPGCPITAIQPFFNDKADDTSFILTGDLLGSASIYPWAAPSMTTESEVTVPVTSFEAHEDGSAVTAVAWNGITLITGSAKGTSSVFDSLTFECLRTFTSPVSRPRGGVTSEDLQSVKQILLNSERDLLVLAVGDKVMAWKAGMVPKNKIAKAKRSPSKQKTHSKGYEQLDLTQRISDSLLSIDEESSHSRRIYQQQREQIENLERLGLDEIEAVEYVLMLSRDEALEREANDAEAGIFEGDFDDMAGPAAQHSSEDDTATESGSISQSSSYTSSTSAFSMSPQSFRSDSVLPARIIPRPTPSYSNNKVQVSPPYRAEPREAGRLFTPSPTSSPSPPRSSNLARANFPAMSPGHLTVGPSGRSNNIGQQAWPAMRKVHTPSTNSAWTKPLKFAPTTARPMTRGEIDEDADLRLAVELSLAEANSLSEAATVV